MSLGLITLLAVSTMLGATPFVAENSDLMSIRGPGDFELVNGTLIRKHFEDGEWIGLYGRNNDSLDIELNVEAGTYYVETWSVASNPMSPQRVHSGFEVVIDGDGGNNPPSYGTADLFALLAAWGPCAGDCPWDLTGDGNVGTADLLILLSLWN
jgi:hypothetical protein